MKVTGLKVLKTGTYQIEVMRWPGIGKAINEELVAGAEVLARVRHFKAQIGRRIGDRCNTAPEWKRSDKKITEGAKKIVFETKLTKGKHVVSNLPSSGRRAGCYYAVITTK